jgi:hypothetical protein
MGGGPRKKLARGAAWDSYLPYFHRRRAATGKFDAANKW